MKFFKDAAENEYEAAAIKRNRIADFIFLVPALILTFLAVITLIFVGTGTIRLIFAGLWAAALVLSVRKGRKKGFWITLFGNTFWAFIVSCVFYLPGAFASETAWRYRFQMKYVDIMRNGSFDCFPDKLPGEISDYRIEYLPSMMQGTGHFRVHFKTSAQQLERYEKEYSAQALYTVPLEDFKGNWDIQVDEVNPKATVYYGDKSLEVAYDKYFWAGHEKDAAVYVVSAVHYWNHPHSGAVIINKAENMIEFTHLG